MYCNSDDGTPKQKNVAKISLGLGDVRRQKNYRMTVVGPYSLSSAVLFMTFVGYTGPI